MADKRVDGVKRIVDVWITLEMPEHLRDMVKDVTLSFHSPSISKDSRAANTPWTDMVRRVGTEDMFGVRMKVPAGGHFLLHAVAIIDEPSLEGQDAPVRRHLGFSNLFVDTSESRVTLSVTLFQNYTLVNPTHPPLAEAGAEAAIL